MDVGPVIPDLDRAARRLRVALWRHAHAAAIEATLTAVSHDLRGALSPAMLSAETILAVPDERAHRASATIIRSIDRAAALITDTIGRLHADAPATPLAAYPLAPLLAEAVALARAERPGIVARTTLAGALRVRAHRGLFVHAIAILLAHLAPPVRLEAHGEGEQVLLALDADGAAPAESRAVLAGRFVACSPPPDHALALATARDLLAAQRAGLDLPDTGPTVIVTLVAA